MKKLLSGLCASALALTFGLATIAPVAAAPVFVPNTGAVSAGIEEVQYLPEWRRPGNSDFRRMDRGRYERRGNHSYYNGHRGYHQARRGYREYNGIWFPAAAFIAGAVIGGTMNSMQPVTGLVEWCASRYQSYRAYDNTFQPYGGPRRQCVRS